jgi:hypothetical protein
MSHLRVDPELNQERARFEAHRECVHILEEAPRGATTDVLVLSRLFVHHREMVRVMEAHHDVHGLLGGEDMPARLVEEQSPGAPPAVR